MSLRQVTRVKLENWRNWQGEASVGDLAAGVVVLFGPNAVGKTGVWEGIVSGLLDRHWGTHTARLRPAGTKGVVPRVEVEFTAGDGRYRVEKHFGAASSRDKASFWEWIDSAWVLRDQGEEAYLLCRRAVLGTEEAAPNRGGPEKALADTLMEVLLPAQGELTTPAPAPEAVSMAVTDREAATAATRLGRVLSAVKTEADGIWVGKRDRPRKGSTLQVEEQRLLEIEEKIAPQKQKSDRIGELIRELQIATSEAAGQPDAAEQAQKAEKLQREAAEHRAKREAAKESLEVGDRALADADAAVADRTSKVTAATEDAARLDGLKREFDSLLKEQKRAEDDHRAQQKKRNHLTEDIRRHRDWVEYENREAQLAQLRKTLQAISDRLSRHDEQERILAEKTAEAKALKVPKKGEWAQLDELRERLQEARGILNAGAWQVTGEVLPEVRLTIDGEEIEGKEIDFPATREVSIVGSEDCALHIRAPAGTAEEVERLTAELSVILQSFQVADLSELRRKYNYLEQEVNPAISQAKSRMEDALAGEARPDLLREQFELGQRIEKIAAQGAPDSERPDRSPEDWKIRLELLHADQGGQEEQFAASGPRASVAAERAERARQALLKGEQDSELSAKTLADHRQRHGTDDALAAVVREAEAAARELRSAWRKLDDDRAMAETAREERAGKLARGLNEVLVAQGRVSKLNTGIETLRQEDPEGALAALEAEKAELLPRLRSARVHAEALRLLETSLSAEKDRVTEFIGEPVRERMQTWISYLLQDESQVVVDEAGRPAVIRNPAGQEVPYEDQSYGTREQVSILHRLAVADLVAKESGAGVVLMLDDPFGHTDRGRRSRMMDILTAEATKRGHQILIFTCRPEDFDGVGTLVPIRRGESPG